MSATPNDPAMPVRANGKDIAGAVGSAFFAIIGAGAFFMSLSMSPLAAMFPRTIGAVMVVLSLVQIAAALTGRSGASLEGDGEATGPRVGLARRLTLIATMTGWALFFPVVGMFVTSLAASVILMFTGQFGRLSPVRITVYLACILVMVGFFYFLMASVLNVPVPRGLLF